MNEGKETGLTYSQLFQLYWKDEYSKFTKQQIVSDILYIAANVPTQEV